MPLNALSPLWRRKNCTSTSERCEATHASSDAAVEPATHRRSSGQARSWLAQSQSPPRPSRVVAFSASIAVPVAKDTVSRSPALQSHAPYFSQAGKSCAGTGLPLKVATQVLSLVIVTLPSLVQSWLKPSKVEQASGLPASLTAVPAGYVS